MKRNRAVTAGHQRCFSFLSFRVRDARTCLYADTDDALKGEKLTEPREEG